MCKYSSSCRKNCENSWDCPHVAAAFGPVKRHKKLEAAGRRAREVSGWWSRSSTRPVARVNAQGIKLCCVSGCDNPRVNAQSMCSEHWREYNRKYYQENKDRMKAQRKARYEAGKG